MVADMTIKGCTQSQDAHLRLLLAIVKRLFDDSEENSVPLTDIMKEAEIHAIEPRETEETLQQLQRYGLINKLPNGKFTLSEMV